MNRFKATDTAILGICVATALALSSCTSMVCMSGVCPTIEERMAQIPWEPPSLSHQNCPNISGKYKPKSYKGFDLMRMFPQSNDRLGFIQVKLETPGQVPGRSIPNPSEDNPHRKRWDDSEFYNSGAYVLIQQNEYELSASLFGGDGKLYRRQTIALNSAMTGCTNGDLIIRTLYTPAGQSQTGWGSPGANETRYRKLADGSLQVISHTREWKYDPAFGLMGKGPTGETNSTGVPRETGSTAIFAPVP